MTRIVSLLPSATEIVCALGAEDDLHGISHECDYPPYITDRPVVTRSRLGTEASSAAIDRAVRAAISEAVSIYAVDANQLAAIAPDLIITQDLCEVCAVSPEDVRAAIARIAHRDDIAILSLSPTRLADVLDDIERVALALGRVEAGRNLRADLTTRLDELADRAATLHMRPSVATIEWIEPLMIGGTWMPELVGLAGGIAVGVTAGGPALTVTSGQLAALAPDVIVIKPCGFSIGRSLDELDRIESLILDAVPRARVYLTDGNAYFNRPGPRLVESTEILAACIDPVAFSDFAAAHAEVILALRD